MAMRTSPSKGSGWIQIISIVITASGAIAVSCVLANGVETLRIKEDKMEKYGRLAECSSDFMQVQE
jgi:hypothetical protein